MSVVAAAKEDPCDLGLRDFRRMAEGRYFLRLDHWGVELEVDRLRRERHELFCELTVRTDLAGAKTIDGVISIADFNMSSSRARQDRARLLQQRARAPQLDWYGALEEMCQRVIGAERAGQPAVLLAEVVRPDRADDAVRAHGLVLPRRHPSILFGDGGAMKSYLMLLIAVELATQGFRIGFFDWELDAPDHRDRLERLCGPRMPNIWYARCERPLVHEADRLRRVVAQAQLNFLMFDSVGFACHGAPESAEAALAYFQAVRQFGPIGSLHNAHISKADDADKKPFGSAFWHAAARATWFVKSSDDPAPGSASIGVFQRKSNLGPLSSPQGFEVTFTDDLTLFRHINLAKVSDLAAKMTIAQRLRGLLRDGARRRDELAAEIGGNAESFRRTLHRAIQKGIVVSFPGADGVETIGLKARGQS